jgi:hypothetical protein
VFVYHGAWRLPEILAVVFAALGVASMATAAAAASRIRLVPKGPCPTAAPAAETPPAPPTGFVTPPPRKREPSGTELMWHNKSAASSADATELVRGGRVKLRWSENGVPEEAELRQFPAVVGREPSAAHIVIEDGSVSRRHARISLEGEGFFIEDMGSSNGTELDGVRATAKRPLFTGQKLRLGRVELDVEILPGQ